MAEVKSENKYSLSFLLLIQPTDQRSPKEKKLVSRSAIAYRNLEKCQACSVARNCFPPQVVQGVIVQV